MNAEVRSLSSPDVDDLRAWVPPDPQCFAFLMRVMIGPAGQDGEEAIDIQVCTPLWLERTFAPDGLVSGWQMLIVFRYDYSMIERYVGKVVSSVSGRTWNEIGQKLTRLGRWEFEDYDVN